MTITLEPLHVPSLKEACIAKLEALILAGEFKIGEKLPSERNLAKRFGISRPVVHEAVVDLAAKGLVEISPRRGVFVRDYHTTGSCALLTTLLSYQEGDLDEPFFRSLLEMRLLMETETARLAALQRTDEHLRQFEALLAREREAESGGLDARALSELDFGFHQLVALSADNLMYVLIINSFKPVYTNITRKFFVTHHGDSVMGETFAYHRRLVAAIAAGDSAAADETMSEMLRHGAANLTIE